LTIAPVFLERSWQAAAFVGAGVDEVLAPLGATREGLLWPCPWLASELMSLDEELTAIG
jgi:branched-chain amino acid transport system substrate-binding protein